MSRVLPRPAVVIATEVVPPDARLAGRTIHPWAWWGWALGAGAAVTLASNPLLLVLLVGVTAAAMGSGHGLRGLHRKNAWLCEKIVGWRKRPWG